jgi:hypothetical protein
MFVEAECSYSAGKWPGEVYRGTVTVSTNTEDEDEDPEWAVKEFLLAKARQKVAQSYGMTTASISIIEFRRVK